MRKKQKTASHLLSHLRFHCCFEVVVLPVGELFAVDYEGWRASELQLDRFPVVRINYPFIRI